MKLENEDCCRNCIYQLYDYRVDEYRCTYHNCALCGDEEGYCADIRYRFHIDKATEVNRDLHMLLKLMENAGVDGSDLLDYIIIGAQEVVNVAQKTDNLIAEFSAKRVINESAILHKRFSKEE